MDQQQQCGRTVVCSSSSNTNNIISSSVMMQQQQSSPSSPSPSSSPPSSPSSSMDMANHQNMLFVHNNNNNNMAGAASARVFSNPSPYHFMMNTSISALPPPPPSDPMITTPSTTMNPLHPPSTNSTMSMRAKIMSHPHFPRLLSAYSNCHKVGAPPDVAARLEEVCGAGATAAVMAAARSSSSSTGNGNYSSIGEDPALDQFMEAYCEMLTKYEQELSKPFKEAMLFLSRIESQFRALTLNNNSSPNSTAGSGGGDFAGRNNGSSEDDMDALDTSYIDPQAEDKELKVQLLRRYSGYLGNLKQEFLKKKKKGKLPKEARQQLLEWWNRHYKWPYPSESQKVALAEATGLDQKQINNWFINQRKRHWKPTEDMQFVVMDAAYPHHYYLENGVGMGSSTNAFPLDFNSSNSHHL